MKAIRLKCPWNHKISAVRGLPNSASDDVHLRMKNITKVTTGVLFPSSYIEIIADDLYMRIVSVTANARD